MTEEVCRTCGQAVLMMCRKNTGFCSEACQETYVDEPVVCIAHGAFIPCRKDGEHRYTSSPFWVKSVRDYQQSPIEDLTWEPAWENEKA